MNRADMRFELAKAALTGLLASANRSGGPESYADDALRYADALLAALNITPETVAESQQVSAGIVQPAYMYRFRGPEMSGFTRGKLYNATTDDDTVYCLDDNGVSRFRPIREFERVDNA